MLSMLSMLLFASLGDCHLVLDTVVPLCAVGMQVGMNGGSGGS
jgi:hypothetical protein